MSCLVGWPYGCSLHVAYSYPQKGSGDVGAFSWSSVPLFNCMCTIQIHIYNVPRPFLRCVLGSGNDHVHSELLSRLGVNHFILLHTMLKVDHLFKPCCQELMTFHPYCSSGTTSHTHEVLVIVQFSMHTCMHGATSRWAVHLSATFS